MGFVLADSVQYFNDGARGHAGIFIARLVWMLVSILTFIIERTTPAGYVPTLKRTRKSKTRLTINKGRKKGLGGQLQIEEGSVYSAEAGFENF